MAVVPSFAQIEWDYIEKEVFDWLSIAYDNGYDVLESKIDVIGTNDVAWSIDIAPGKYKIYASGGLRVTDIDTFVFDESGEQLDYDNEPDKIPIVEFTVDFRQTILFTISAYSFEEGFDEGDYCFVIASLEKGGQVFSAERKIVQSGDMVWDDESMMNFAEQSLALHESYAAEMYLDVVEKGIVTAGYEEFSIETTLGPGYYAISAESDPRCTDLAMVVYDSDMRELSADKAVHTNPVCHLYLGEPTDVSIFLDVFSLLPGMEETHIAYLIARSDDISDMDRLEILTFKIENVVTNALNNLMEIGRGIEQISARNNVVSIDYQLDAGYYEIYSLGDVFLTDIDMAIYGESGNLIDEDTLPDNYPICYVILDEPETIRIEVTAYEFAGDKHDAHFGWLIATESNVLGYMDEDGVYVNWSGENDELVANAEKLAQEWLQIIEDNGEILIESFTEPVYDTGEINGWEKEFELQRGTYYFYAQGDDISLIDLDMVIYDENWEIVASNEEPDNYPWCTITVPRSGGTYTVAVYAFELKGTVGYFWLGVTKE